MHKLFNSIIFLGLITSTSAVIANGGGYGSVANLQAHKSAATRTSHYLRHFTGINARDVRIELTTGTRQQVSIQGPVSAQVSHNTLELAPSNAQATGLVKITSPYLNTIALSGNARLNGTNLHSYIPLTVQLRDSAVLTLQGEIHLQNLICTGNGSANIAWTASRQLTVQSSCSNALQIAGVANSLDAKLSQQAVLDTQYLRADAALVKTTDSATANVTPIRSLSAFAYDNSNIYYYKSSRHLLFDTANSGNILQVAYWH